MYAGGSEAAQHSARPAESIRVHEYLSPISRKGRPAVSMYVRVCVSLADDISQYILFDKKTSREYVLARLQLIYIH